MKRFQLRSLGLLFSLVVLASAANAGSGALWVNSTVPAAIVLVGSANGSPDAGMGQFTVVVRDLANNPVRGASVVVDLSNCADLALCDDQLDPTALVNCAAKTTRKFADGNGSVTFTVLGGSNGAGGAMTLQAGGRIYANGVLIGSPMVAAYDLDDGGGVGANDLSAWLTDFGTGEAYGRSDYDASGTVGANDLSFWLSAFGAAGSTSSCLIACP